MQGGAFSGHCIKTMDAVPHSCSGHLRAWGLSGIHFPFLEYPKFLYQYYFFLIVIPFPQL